MSTKNTLTAEELLEHIVKEIEYAEGIIDQSFHNETYLKAMCRSIEIAGEAANRFVKKFSPDQSPIPWRDLIDMRNRLIHGYDSIIPNVVWEVAKRDFIPLKPHLRALIEHHKSGN